MHGYALADALEGGLGAALGMKRSAVYAILKRLAERGWVSAEAEREGNYPERATYSLSAEGTAALPDLVGACVSSGSGTLLPLLAVLAQVDHLPTHDRTSLLTKLIADRQKALADLQPFIGHEGASGAAFELRRRHLTAEVDVLKGLLAD